MPQAITNSYTHEPSSTTQTLKVRLSSWNNNNRKVIFDVSPTVAESRTITYDTLPVVHMPGTFYVYKSTSSRTFSLGDVKLISRNPTEARWNLKRLNILRAWGMPYFGGASQDIQAQQRENLAQYRADKSNSNEAEPQLRRVQNEFQQFLGAPPDVLLLSAYSGTSANQQYYGNINEVTVVLTSLTINYPNDVDYIPCAGDSQDQELGIEVDTLGSNDLYAGTPVPTIMSIGIELAEIHSPGEFQRFSIDDFRKGKLMRF